MKNKYVVFDAITLFLILFVVLVLAYMITTKTKTEERNMVVSVNIGYAPQARLVYGEATKLKPIYFDSVDRKLETVKVEKTLDKDGQINDITVYVKGKGNITDSRIIFNGLRIMVGQKAELHGNFFASGVVKSISYE